MLIYKNTIDFCILILYTETLLITLILVDYFIDFIGFSILMIISSTNKEFYFTSSLSIWMPVITFSCLIALARTSDTMLNRSTKNRDPRLVSDLKGKHSVYYWNMMSVVGFSKKPFTRLRKYPSFLSLLRVLGGIGVRFCQKKCINWDDCMALKFINKVNYINWFSGIKPILYSLIALL